MTEWRRRNPKRSTTEMGQENQRSCSRALQRQASFIANRGWKSSNSSPLSVGGELFPLTSPFIEQAITLKTPVAGFCHSKPQIGREDERGDQTPARPAVQFSGFLGCSGS